MNQEVIITYPQEWENEYKSTRFVSLWRETYPHMFAEYRGSAKLGWLDLFPQYALMFLLRRDHGIHSVTWYKLAGNNDPATVPEVIQKRWRIMRQ